MTGTISERKRNMEGENAFLHYIVETQLGWCGLCSRGQGLWRTSAFHSGPQAALRALELPVETPEGRHDPLLKRAGDWLRGFCEGRPLPDAVPLDLNNQTDFTRTVLQECSGIPYGGIVTYQELAARAGRPGAARAVGQVMRRNPLAPFVPCHRVLGAGGLLTGFGGGLPLKARLLELEGWKVKGSPGEKPRVCMAAAPGTDACLPAPARHA